MTNVIFGKYILDKDVTPRMLVGTIITVLGTILTIVFCSHEAAPIETTEVFPSLFVDAL